MKGYSDACLVGQRSRNYPARLGKRGNPRQETFEGADVMFCKVCRTALLNFTVAPSVCGASSMGLFRPRNANLEDNRGTVRHFMALSLFCSTGMI